ncbi:peptidoglycan/LPS O-acetylase OafA/YrhL [Microbacterium testaceum]|nr:peptidoglycan/LPS O-acetylase OafA/YrhL [Microbacterium sp. SORGH_AS_0969]MDQ1117158.1 peptidoglycan/LPS O-acetylase OafA/YrhL [Microbacterium testaceum]
MVRGVSSTAGLVPRSLQRVSDGANLEERRLSLDRAVRRMLGAVTVRHPVAAVPSVTDRLGLPWHVPMVSTPIRPRAERASVDATGFLPHIQGLRAIAVLGVVVFHLWPRMLPGGFAGVDVFFVISGFLITGHLARELSRTGTVRLAAFWARRARRLLPAALIVLCFCAIVVSTPTLAPLSALPLRVKEIVASTFYVTNWHLVTTSANYFGDSNSPTFARHYWSLSVEEQFYLVWPLAILLGAAIGRRLTGRTRAGVVGAVVLMTCVSLMASVWFTAFSPAAAYFATFTRVWEFGAGALLALLPTLHPKPVWCRVLLGWLGLAGLAACFALLSDAVHFPGSAALLPVLSTVAVIAAGADGPWWFPARLISLPPFAFVGKISYSLYLWHWPLILIAPALAWWSGTGAQMLCLLVVTIVFAWLTQRFIEDPVRSWHPLRDARPRRTFLVAAGAMLLVSLLSVGLAAANFPRYLAGEATITQLQSEPGPCVGAHQVLDAGCAETVHEGYAPEAAIAGMDLPPASQCLAQFGDDRVAPCSFGASDPAAPEVLLIGDSHAFQYIDVLAKSAVEKGWRLTTVLKGGCPWNTTALSEEVPFARVCATWQENVSAWLRDQKPDVVVTSAFARTHFSAEGHATATDAAADGFRLAWESMSNRGTPIVAIRDNPTFATNPNICLLNREPVDCRAPRSEALPALDPMLLAAESVDGILVIDNTEVFCDQDRCSPVIGGRNAYRDSDHLTASFAATLGDRVVAGISRALEADTPRGP